MAFLKINGFITINYFINLVYLSEPIGDKLQLS